VNKNTKRADFRRLWMRACSLYRKTKDEVQQKAKSSVLTFWRLRLQLRQTQGQAHLRCV
jgi:hypothetical protein